MTKQPVSDNIRDLVRLGALAMLVISGRVGYLLYAGHLWLTLAVLALKVGCTMAAFMLTFQHRARTGTPKVVAPSALLIVLFVCGSAFADFAVATLVR